MKILNISALVLALTAAPVMNAYATNVERSLEKAEARAEKAVSDTVITTKVKERFMEEKELSALEIHVKTNNQIVTLTGRVDSKEARDFAVDLAKGVKDVKDVKSYLKIKHRT